MKRYRVRCGALDVTVEADSYDNAIRNAVARALAMAEEDDERPPRLGRYIWIVEVAGEEVFQNAMTAMEGLGIAVDSTGRLTGGVTV